jgi:hypothetical protein
MLTGDAWRAPSGYYQRPGEHDVKIEDLEHWIPLGSFMETRYSMIKVIGCPNSGCKKND